MKRVLSQITLCAILFLAMSGLVACDNPILESRVPQKFPGSRWESDDGSITFTCFQSDENRRFAIGQIVIEEEVINFEMKSTRGGWQHLYYYEDGDGTISHPLTEQFEIWNCDYPSKKRFVATVVTTTYFEIDQKIVFHRVDEEQVTGLHAGQSKNVPTWTRSQGRVVFSSLCFENLHTYP